MQLDKVGSICNGLQCVCARMELARMLKCTSVWQMRTEYLMSLRKEKICSGEERLGLTANRGRPVDFEEDTRADEEDNASHRRQEEGGVN